MQRVLRSGRFTMGEQVRAVRGGVRGALRHEARRDGELGIVGEPRRRRRALLPIEPAAAARRRSHRPGHLVGDDVSSAAAVRVEAAVRRRRARHAQHGRVEARGGADAAHADGRRGQHPRQPGRRSIAIRAFCDAHDLDPLRGQLRVDGRQPERPALRHVRRHQHVQHVLLPPHLDDGRRAAGDERHGDRSSRARHPQSRVGARRAGRLGRSTRASGTTIRSSRRTGSSCPATTCGRSSSRGAVGHRAAQEARRHAGDAPAERRAFRRVCSRTISASSSSARTARARGSASPSS